MWVLIARSSWMRTAMFLAYHRDSQSRMIPTRKPIGWIFCPTQSPPPIYPVYPVYPVFPVSLHWTGRTGETGETQRYPPLSATTTVTWLLRLVMMSARPRARGCTRFVDGPSSAYARETFSVSRSSSRLFSALATADFKTFSTARAARDDVNRCIASASFTG